jgi:hypothetical protein
VEFFVFSRFVEYHHLQNLINEHKPYGILNVFKVLDMMQIASNLMCQERLNIGNPCTLAIDGFCGVNSGERELDPKIPPIIMKYLSHTVSVKQINHYLQLHSSGKFRQYDYQNDNQKIYNSDSPPEYNLHNVRAPIYLYSAGCDALVSVIDVRYLKQSLSNVRRLRNFENYNHCDFEYGKNARWIVHEGILRDMNSERV